MLPSSPIRILIVFFLLFIGIPCLAVTVSPASAALKEYATQQFTASTPSTWSTTCGSISSAGLFRAPLYPTTTCTVKATATNGSGSVTANITVTSPITMTPSSAKTPQGKTQQFTASMPVTWTAKCGTITATGLYTATGAVGTSCSIEGIATGTVKYTVYGTDTVTAPVTTTFAVSPALATVSENGTVQFTANRAATWSQTCGSVSSTGLFRAPLYATTTCTVKATATDGSGSSTAKVTVTSPITMTPSIAKTPQGSTQQFTASMPVTWTAKCGTITATGLYTATGTVGTSCSIEAISSGTVKYTVYGTDTVTAPVSTTFAVSPASATVSENGTAQFTANRAATWSQTCGSVSSTGLFKAPLYATTTCTVKATATDGSGSSTAKVTVTSPITMTPSIAKTPQGSTQQFTASMPVTWTAKCGTITATGLYTATGTVGTSCSIEAISSGTVKYTVYGTDTIIAPVTTTFTISPLSPTMTEGGQQQFTASSGATYTASCGTISSTGLFTAPLAPASCTITATATDGSGHTASTVAKVSSPIVITPSSATTPQGQTQQFTASSPVSWAASCGSINASGLFTASATPGSACKITATATSGTAYTANVIDTIGAAPALVISPLSPTITEGGQQQFTASVAATWTSSCGTIGSTSGLFTAPLSPSSCTITATASDGSGHVASTVATIPSPLTISPTTASTGQGQTQQFNANAPVTWTASCGSINANGLFTATATQGSVCTITATASSGTAYTATARDTIGPAPAFSLSPLSPTISENATQQFVTSLPATFTASCGSIDANSGLYTAPLAAGPCTVTATEISDSSKTASTTVTVTSPLVITPSVTSTGAESTQQFTSNLPATWQSSCGSIDVNGLFTAPISQGAVCTITATASSGTPYVGTVTDTIGAPPAISIAPLTPTLSEAATQQFTSNIPATFSATCGTIDANAGSYTAPLIAGQCTITATASDGTGNTASTNATVTSPIIITPAAATTTQNATQPFSANVPVTWSSSCGVIDDTGLFTAPASTGTVCQITATAATGTPYTATVNDNVSEFDQLTLSPLNPSVSQGATLQFATNMPASFTASCGSIDPTGGLYTAPLTSGTCTVTATSSDASAQVFSTTVTVSSPLTIQPSTAGTPQGLTQQFTANMAVQWSASCGSIDANGNFTASASPGSSCTITATATGGTAYTATASDTISAPPTLILSPSTQTLSENATQQFSANAPATYSATCGSITSAGLYTAPLVTGSCTINATPVYGGGTNASAAVTVTSPIVISPASATTGAGLTQQFTANLAVAWTATCGSISSSGLFTASTTQGSVCIIKATATGGTAYTATASDTISAPPTLTLSPSTQTLSENATQQFSTNVPATYGATCGSITSAGLYTAPLVPGSCTINATPVYGGGSNASAKVTVTSPLTISPASATTGAGLTQQFTANMAVAWTATCGSISSSGLFTAPATQGSVCTIKATATGGVAYTNTASDTIGAAGTFTISPTQITLQQNATQQFSATAPASWSATCGSITASGGLYTAPLTIGSCTVNASATDGSGRTASTTVTVNSPMTITPASTKLHALNTKTLTASQAVTWSTSCGSITTAGVFTAPSTAGTCTITATASSGPAYTAKASITVDVVNQVRWRNSTGGTGLQSDELLLTPSNVNSTTFGQAWSATVDGGVWAQPLYMNGLTVNGATHNVLFVGTDHDTMYALDADTGAQLWKQSLLPSGATPVSGSMVSDTNIPFIGILGTPVIDSGTLYVVAETAEQTATVFPHRLHALDLTTGQEKFGGPVLISDPNLQPAHKLQRPGLTVANGNVYVSTGSLADKAPYHGLVFAFNKTTLAEVGVWNSTPSGTEGGIWMAGGAPSVDSSGNIYVMTGNGFSDGVNNFGESAIKLSPSLQVLSFFTPHNAAALTAADLDLGSASVPVMPDVNGQFPHELIFCGKSPVIYVVNRDSMGGFNSTTDNIVQELSNVIGGTATTRDSGQACFTSPSSWGTNVYFIANGDVLKQFTLNTSTGKLSTAPAHQGSFAYGWPGSQSMISSNGTTNGIIWSFDNVGKKLRADDATNVSTNLYVSPAIGTGYVKWATPTVINGHVYIGGQGTVVAFGAK